MEKERLLELPSNYVELLDENDKHIGWISEIDCDRLGYEVTSEAPAPKFTHDPYIIQHSDLLYHRGYLTNGQDLNFVQVAMLASYIYRDNERKLKASEIEFLNNLWMTNQALYWDYLEAKDKTEDEDVSVTVEDGEAIEWKRPETEEDMFKIISTFADVMSDEDVEEQQGAVTSWLSPDDIEMMTD